MMGWEDTFQDIREWRRVSFRLRWQVIYHLTTRALTSFRTRKNVCLLPSRSSFRSMHLYWHYTLHRKSSAGRWWLCCGVIIKCGVFLFGQIAARSMNCKWVRIKVVVYSAEHERTNERLARRDHPCFFYLLPYECLWHKTLNKTAQNIF